MAVVIPIIASFASAAAAVTAAGSIAAAMSTVSGFLSIAGAALTTIGAVTGKKDLMKIGGFMSLGGGIGTAFNAAAEAAGTAAAQEAANASWSAGGAAEVAGGAGVQAAAPIAEAASSLAPDLATSAAKDFGGQLNQSLYTRAPELAANPALDAGLANGVTGSNPAVAAPALVDPTVAAPGLQSAASKIAEGGQSMTMADLQGYMKTGYNAVKPIASGALDFIQKNPNASAMGLQALSSMYGPEAERMDYTKSIYERRMKNLNSPVKLNFGGS